MNSFYTNLTKTFGIEMSKFGTGITSVLGLFFNLFMCFFGYRFMKVIISIVGFVFGSATTYYFINKVPITDPLKIIIAIIVGILIGWIAYVLYKLGMFIMCSTLAFSVVLLALGSSLSSTIVLIISTIVGLLVGAVSLYFIKPVTIISTFLSGGLNIIFAVFTLCNYSNDILKIILGLVLAGLGIYFQFKNTNDIKA